MNFRRLPSLDTFMPKINGGVPTSALEQALKRELLKRMSGLETELPQVVRPKQQTPKPSTTKGD